VLGPPREIQEVRNAFAAYERLLDLNPADPQALLEAHRVLMEGLLEDAGRYRRGGVGVAKGDEVVHVAPPAERVPGLINDLLGWLDTTEHHPLIAGGVVHYELEFIHPFADGNGRIGRLWQTVVLAHWKPLFAYLPVESVVRDQQGDYYAALAASDKEGSATAFLEFMLPAIQQTLAQLSETDQVTDQVTDHVARLLLALVESPNPLSVNQLMGVLSLKHRPTFRMNYLEPALAQGLVERTDPGSLSSPKQRYRLTALGTQFAQR
jgi:Fic family protein